MGKRSNSGNMMDLLAASGFQVSDEAREDNARKEKEAESKDRDRYKNYDPSKNRNSQNRNNSQKGQTGTGNKYVGAPYNFVPFAKDILEAGEECLSPHDRMDEKLYSGELEYTVAACTDIAVGGLPVSSGENAPQDFYRTVDGKYAIPGSTMRGLIRNNVQILGCASFKNDIDDYALMYRSVGQAKGDPNKDIYDGILGSGTIPYNGSTLSILKNVKAGYIEKRNGKYVILHTKPDIISKDFAEMNYYVISEKHIINSHLDNPNDTSFQFLFDNNLTQNNPEVRIIKDEGNGRARWKGEQNKDYRPSYTKVSYELKGLRTVTAIGKPGKYKNTGYLVGTGYMNEKKALYVIPEPDESTETWIPDSDIKAFNVDFEKKKNQDHIRSNKRFYSLPEEDGQRKPVFYISLGEKLYFGFTPRLRLFYDHTILEGLPDSQKQDGILDLAKSMFGFMEGEGFKTKLSFSDAEQCKGSTDTKDISLILGEPKASSYNDYLISRGDNAVSYSDEEFSLRGVKQYWLRDETEKTEFDPKKIKVYSHFKALPAGAEFKGKIRFSNLTEDEFGLLLWSIRLEKESHMNVGKAKAYGYGNVVVSLGEIKLFNHKKAYELDDLCMDPWDRNSVDIDKQIALYKKKLAAFLHVDNVMDNETINTFFSMKDSTNMPDRKDIRFMDINASEYQNRRPLPSAEEVLKKK